MTVDNPPKRRGARTPDLEAGEVHVVVLLLLLDSQEMSVLNVCAPKDEPRYINNEHEPASENRCNEAGSSK